MSEPQNQPSTHVPPIIKQEPVETDQLVSPIQDIQDVFVKKEILFLHEWESPDGFNSASDPVSIKKEFLHDWELPGGLDSAWDPLSIKEEEHEPEETSFSLCSNLHIKSDLGFSPSEDFPGPSTLNIEKTQVEEEDDDEVEAVSQDGWEEFSPSEDFPGPSTLSIEKTEEEDEEDVAEAVSQDDWEELKYEVELTSSSCAPERLMHCCWPLNLHYHQPKKDHPQAPVLMAYQ